jgi:GTP cyclohydrolase IA
MDMTLCDEKQAVNFERLKMLGRELLIALGEDPEREGLRETPERWAKMWREFVEYQPGKIETAFAKIESDQMVVVRGLRVHTFCEHHLLPFTCTVCIGYIAEKKVLGLSKLARIAHLYAHQLQIQERLVNQIADEVVKQSGSSDVAVVAIGAHSCMSMRGIRTEGEIVCAAIKGRFRHDQAMRAEFMGFAGVQQR